MTATEFLYYLDGTDGDGQFTFQTFDDSQEKRPDLARVFHGILEEHADELAEANSRGAGIFVTVNRTDGYGRRRENITGLRALFVDSDDGPLPRDLPLRPSILVHTPAGEHGYWLLKPEEPLEEFSEAQSALAAALGTDPKVKDLPRVMRLPGFHHNKAEPCMVTSTILDGYTRYSIDDVVDAFGLRIGTPQEPDRSQAAPGFSLDAILSGLDRDMLVSSCASYLRKVPPAVQGAGGDNHTYRTACIGGDFGLTEQEYWPLLLEWNRKCSPPWTEDDLREKLTGAYKYRERPLGIKLASWAENESDRSQKSVFLEKARRNTEADLSDALIDALEKDGPVVSTGSQLYRYCSDTGLWKEVPKAVQVETIRGFDGATVVEDGKAVDLKLHWNRATGTQKFAMHNARRFRAGFFHSPAPGIACSNGFVTVTADGVFLEPHGPDHRARHGMSYEFDDNARAPRWSELLEGVFLGDGDSNEKRLLLQEFVGACMCGVASSYDKCLVLVGGGGNGKSTIQEAITDNLFPPEAIGRVAPQRWSKDYYLSRLSGKLINVVPELPSERILAGDIFKAVVTGDVVQAKDLYEDPYDMVPRAGHLFAANELPGTGDYTDAFFDRFLVLTFNRNFRDQPGWVSRAEILAELQQEAPGILLWALRGAVRLMKRREYTLPVSATEAKQEWRESKDHVLGWVGERARVGDGFRTAVDDAYKDYIEWCQKSGFTKPCAKPVFSKRLKKNGVSLLASSGRFYSLELVGFAEW